MPKYTNLEISLLPEVKGEYNGRYSVELRFAQPDDDANVAPVLGTAEINLDELRALTTNVPGYSKLLSQSLFGDPNLQLGLSNARVVSREMRLQLYIDSSIPELHNLYWEMLQDPRDGTVFATNENILFSRYIGSQDWLPVRLRPKAALTALVVVASPADLPTYSPNGRPLPLLDVEAELARARDALKGIYDLTVLASGKGGPTVNNIVDQLRKGPDILYLVCHGALIKGVPHLWLEGEDGKAEVVSGSQFVTRLSELQQRPRLVVLASCQSAGIGDGASSADEGALSALGPRLAQVGVPAVLAMQGNITVRTASAFTKIFFTELQTDGQIDRATTVARSAVRQELDAYMPVLFMRLKSGRIWYEPGFDRDRPGFDKWPGLINSIINGRCTPILGSGLLESILGSTREIAKRWADTYNYPMEAHEREDLPQVAQFLAVKQGTLFVRDQFKEYLRQELLHRYSVDSPDGPDLQQLGLEALISAVGKQHRDNNEAEPHKVLASLPCKIYITSNPDNLLVEALRDAGKAKDPQVALCPWNTSAIGAEPPDYQVHEAQRPLVYYLFGNLSDLDSVVLTEDDYFDYLIGATKNSELIPSAVRLAWANTSLLFLGFRLDDWDFRVLFRSIKAQEGAIARDRFAHVAVQIDPEGSSNIESAGARRYLESYFGKSDIGVYWGSVEDFAKDLKERLDNKLALSNKGGG